jgi:hypothetical protein
VTWWFSPGFPVSCTYKTDCHDITEILLKVALNTIKILQGISMEVHPVTNITLKYKQNIGLIQVFMVRLIVFNATFNNISVISWQSVL